MDDKIEISKAQLTQWAESLIHMNHHGTLIKKELPKGDLTRAANLTERAWKMLNEMFELGAEKPEGYCEPKI